jgi:hypothetical protein
VVFSGLQKVEVLVMSVLLITVKTSVLIISIIQVPINLLSRPPLVAITTVPSEYPSASKSCAVIFESWN